jgi:hypothetical protein
MERIFQRAREKLRENRENISVGGKNKTKNNIRKESSAFASHHLLS